jgi:hypothetical protein
MDLTMPSRPVLGLTTLSHAERGGRADRGPLPPLTVAGGKGAPTADGWPLERDRVWADGREKPLIKVKSLLLLPDIPVNGHTAVSPRATSKVGTQCGLKEAPRSRLRWAVRWLRVDGATPLLPSVPSFSSWPFSMPSSGYRLMTLLHRAERGALMWSTPLRRDARQTAPRIGTRWGVVGHRVR